MSKCMTCKYALYDGMCLAQGKFTLLDAQACDDYKPRIDFEASQLKAENAKLQDENARLRSCLSDDAENARMIMAENAKLRELVRVMFYCMQCERECDECRMNGADGAVTELVGCDGLRDCMRELGVEVD